jgi:hypothetical protein
LLLVQNSVPSQVLLQKPVILLDAFGKTAPFHLDFIDSLDAFIAVLKIRSRQAGVKDGGLRKLDDREFYIQETERKRNIDITRPWGHVFRPGQNVDMSMVFRRYLTPSACPECGSENRDGDDDQEIEWYVIPFLSPYIPSSCPRPCSNLGSPSVGFGFVVSLL